MILSYFMFIYTDFVSDDQIKINGGQAFVSIFEANIVVNLLIVLVIGVKQIKDKVTRWVRYMKMRWRGQVKLKPKRKITLTVID